MTAATHTGADQDTGRADRAERAEARASRADRAGPADRIDPADLRDRADRLDRAEPPDRPDRPDRADRADRPDRPDRPERPGRVDEFAVRVYEHVLARGAATPAVLAGDLGALPSRVEQALDVLRGLRLVREHDHRPGELAAVSPEAARMELLVPLEQAIHDKRRRLAGVKGRLLSFSEAFDNVQRDRPRQETVVTAGRAEIELRLTEAAQRASAEMLMMQPCTAQEPPELAHARSLVPAALRGGAQVRVLYPHTARADAVPRARLRELLDAGGQVRTTRESHSCFLVFDRKVAFVQVDDGRGGESGIAAVYDASVATFLAGIHDRVWQSAFDVGSTAIGHVDRMDDLKSAILELLSSGIKDEAIARRLGISERSFRRHLAAIMQDFSAGSRFQAGVLAARTGLVGPVDPAGPARRPATATTATTEVGDDGDGDDGEASR